MSDELMKLDDLKEQLDWDAKGDTMKDKAEATIMDARMDQLRGWLDELDMEDQKDNKQRKAALLEWLNGFVKSQLSGRKAKGSTYKVSTGNKDYVVRYGNVALNMDEKDYKEGENISFPVGVRPDRDGLLPWQRMPYLVEVEA